MKHIEASSTVPKKAAKPISEGASRRNSLLLRSLFLVAAIAVAAWGIVQGPWYQNRMYSRLSLAQLMKAVKSQKNNPTFLYWFGKRLNESGQFKPASVVLSRACNLDQNSVRLRSEWTKALLATGMVTSAFNQLKQFEGTHPHIADSHFLLGRFYYTQHALQLCKVEMQQAVAINPQSARSWAYLSAAEAQLKQPKQALRAALRAVELDQSQPDYKVALGMLLLDEKRNSEAEHQFADAALLAPRSEVPHLALAKLYQATGKVDLAAAQAKDAVAVAPADSDALFILGSLLLQQNQAANAIPVLQRAAKVDPYNGQIAHSLSVAFKSVGRQPEADYFAGVSDELIGLSNQIKAAQARVDSHPSDSLSQKKLADLLAQTNDTIGAIDHFAAALHHPPDSPQVLDATAAALLRFRHLPGALELAKRAEHAATGSPAAHETLGDVYLASGRVNDAESEYNSVINWLPAKKRELVARVTAFTVQAKNDKKALQDFQKASSMDMEGYSNKAIARKALSLAGSAVKLDPDNVLYSQYLLMLQRRWGTLDQATQTAGHIVRLLPNVMGVRVVYATFLAERNKPGDVAAATRQLSPVAYYPHFASSARLVRGIIAVNQHEPALAVRLIGKAVKETPGNRVSYLYLSRAETMVGNSYAAAVNFQQYKSMSGCPF